MKVREIIEVYAILGKAKIVKLDDEEIGKVLDARKVMRPVESEYKAFEEDVYEKLKDDGLEEAEKIRKEVIAKFKENENYEPTECEVSALKLINEYVIKIENAKAKELNKEVELKFDPLKKVSIRKLMKENDWTVNETELIESVLG